MQSSFWIGLGFWAAGSFACAGASDGEAATSADSGAAETPVASSPCADAGTGTIGARDGDGRQAVNGFDLADPDAALEAFARLRGSEKLEVQLEHRGCPTTLDINIQ